MTPPIKLKNGATPLAFYWHEQEPGLYYQGIVLAEWNGQFVTWEFGQRPGDDDYDCETGHYFPTRELAEFDFGLRLRMPMPSTTIRGVSYHS